MVPRRFDTTSVEQIELRLPPSPAAPAAARGALRPLQKAVELELLESVQLLVSELVTNSVRHAGLGAADRIELRVETTDDCVRALVSDPGGGFDRPLPSPRPEEPFGWGLFLVNSLADRWGVERDGETVVWFEIDRRSDGG